MISLRRSQDGTVVSYLLNINGFETARHRKYMRKLNSSNNTEEQIERALPREQAGEREPRQPVQAAAPQPRRSERLMAGARDGI